MPKRFIKTLSGAGHHAYQCDLSRPDAVSHVLAAIERDLGPLYAGIHAAGEMPKQKQLNQLSVEEFRAELEHSLMPAFIFLSQCAAILKSHGDGLLIGITTAGVVTQRGTHARGAYSAVKFGQQGILVALREELAKSGVRVYSVAPGVMPGGLIAPPHGCFLISLRKRTPEKKLASADDVAAAVSSLIKSDNDQNSMTILIAPETE